VTACILSAAGTSGCQPSPPPVTGELQFVRDGVILPSAGDGQALPDGRSLLLQDWSPGESVSAGGITAVAPSLAECSRLFSVDLGDVARLVAMGGAAPNTSLAFSPDGATLAVGSYRGEVLLLDAWSGTVLARRSLAETMVKSVTWSEDGSTLYAAEQSPDAYVHAMEPSDLTSRWTLRLADIVGTSTAPSGEDLYGVYRLPAAYGLEVLPGGELLIAAHHSWKENGEKLNRSQLLRVSPEGAITARWPDQPADARLRHPRIDVESDQLVISVTRNAAGPDPDDLPIGGVAVLSLSTLTLEQAIVPEPLEPFFTRANVWEGLDISKDGVFLGLTDGRIQIYSSQDELVLEEATGAPIQAGDIPIHASIGWGFFHGDGVVYSTSNTLIPYGAKTQAHRPPSLHPGENTLWSLRLDGTRRWLWTGPQILDGMALSDDGKHLIVAAGDRQTDDRRDLYGALVFDLSEPDSTSSGADRLETFCPTQGPAFYRLAMAEDGRVALAEYPYLDENNTVVGHYRITVMR
jgi:hypothetical protein